VPDEWIDKIFAVMALSPQHTFQVLTKRAKRMREYVSTRAGDWNIVLPDAFRPGALPISRHAVIAHLGDTTEEHRKLYDAKPTRWPLPNVWLGVTAEDQLATVRKERDEARRYEERQNEEIERADRALQRIGMALGSTDEWADQGSMIFDVVSRVEGVAAQLVTVTKERDAALADLAVSEDELAELNAQIEAGEQEG